MESALPERSGPGVAAAGLNPVLPSSVAPRGSPTPPTDDDGGRMDGGVPASAQESDAPPESPPPSNRAPGVPALPGAAQVVTPLDELTGDRPCVAISVDPSGMFCGRVDRMVSGDVSRMPADGCVPGNVA